MANTNLFTTRTRINTPAQAETTNAAGGRAFQSSPKHALAQIAATNCFNGTYYVRAEDNLKIAKDAAQALRDDPYFLAQAAVYTRSKGYMKDTPAFLTVMLADVCRGLADSDPNKTLFRRVFRKVIDNGKMLRNVIAMARSGAVTGTKANMGSGTYRNAINEWFDTKSPFAIFKASIGNDPSMRDILRMARPKPSTPEKAALFAYMKGGCFDKKDGMFRTWKRVNPQSKTGETFLAHEHSFNDLPEFVQNYELYKINREGNLPKVDFRMLDSLGLTNDEWMQVADNAPYMMTFMNLATFQRHGVFENKQLTNKIAERLCDRGEIDRARVFPYKLYQAYKMTDGLPMVIQESLQDAIDFSLNNVPTIDGQIYIAVDTSGSMGCGVTGFRGTASTKVRCVDQAALFASAILRKNPTAKILPFDTRIHDMRFNPRDSVATNTDKLASLGGGGTNCSLPLNMLNSQRAKADAVIYISDYESWVDSGYGYYRGGTGMLAEWQQFKQHNPDANLICMDLTPRANSQVQERPGILQVGGFSDQVFDVIASFTESGAEGSDHWVREIENVEIGPFGNPVAQVVNSIFDN